MTADMKTLREAVTILEDLTDEVPLEAKQQHPLWPSECVANLIAALDELEALRGQAAYVASLDTENQRLRAEKAEAQRDELLAALERVNGERDWDCWSDKRCGACTWCEVQAAIANARGNHE